TLRRIFDQNAIPRPLSKGAARHLARIARGLVFTTNFDRVLEVPFEDAGRSFREVFAGSCIREASRAVQCPDNLPSVQRELRFPLARSPESRRFDGRSTKYSAQQAPQDPPQA